MINLPHYEDVEGNPIISRLGSYLAWRAHFQGSLPDPTFDDHGICTICHGFKLVHVRVGEAHETVRCLCDLKNEERRLTRELYPYRSLHAQSSMDAFEIWGTPRSRLTLTEISQTVQGWMLWPNKWLTLLGIVGCGKSHVLTALATTFGPWALYLTMGDFEHKVFQALDEDALPLMLDTIKRAPILLLDDLGSDYGKDFVRSALRKVIDFRYLMWQEFPTVVATNLGASDLRQYDQRIADRLLDRGKVTFLVFEEVSSWRRDGRH